MACRSDVLTGKGLDLRIMQGFLLEASEQHHVLLVEFGVEDADPYV